MKTVLVIFCAVFVGPSLAFPSRNAYPKRSVMLSSGGYYANPMFRGMYPSMTTLVAGDTVATNSFSGGQGWLPEEEETNETVEQVTEKVLKPDWIQEQPESEEQEIFSPNIENGSTEEVVTVKVSTTKAPKGPKRVAPKKTIKPAKPQEEEEEEEDLPASWPFAGNGRGIPSYNAFFPIMIGAGYGPGIRARSGDVSSAADEGGYYPGAATAIANSFSTGKGGVATSHATSFGDPQLATLLRNGGVFRKKSKAQRED